MLYMELGTVLVLLQCCRRKWRRFSHAPTCYTHISRPSMHKHPQHETHIAHRRILFAHNNTLHHSPRFYFVLLGSSRPNWLDYSYVHYHLLHTFTFCKESWAFALYIIISSSPLDSSWTHTVTPSYKTCKTHFGLSTSSSMVHCLWQSFARDPEILWLALIR